MSNYTIRPMTEVEEKYVFPKSSEIMAKSGFMGSARMNFGKDGEANTNYRWEPFGRSKQTEEFTLEVADVLNSLSPQMFKNEGKTSDEKFDVIEILGTKALFTDNRLSPEEIPDGLYAYCLRHSDDGSHFVSVEPKVGVNFGGTIVTKKPLDFKGETYIPLNDDTCPNFLGYSATMKNFEYSFIESKMTNETQYYGLRIDSDKYSYLMCVNPTRCWHNVYCYCYEKQWLDKQISKAHKGIRFVDNEYNTKFHIPDGGQIIITASDGNKSLYTCRYIDDYHMELTSANGSSDIQHIDQFAEKMARWGATYEPAEVVSMPVPDAYLTNEKVKTPRGTFSLTAMSKEQMEKAGYGVHHMTEDNQFYIMGNGKRAFAVSIDRDDPINRDTQPKEPTSLIQPKKNKDYER